MAFIVDEKPTFAGIGPYNKLIDRNPEDNLIAGEEIPCDGRPVEQMIFCSLSNTCGEAIGFETGSDRFSAFLLCVEIVLAPGKRFYPEGHLRAKWASDVRATLE